MRTNTQTKREQDKIDRNILRILHTLLHLGYVEADGRLFRLTPKVLDLGYAYLST